MRSNHIDEMVPNMIWFCSAATNDHVDKLTYYSNTIYVFDNRYKDYKAFDKFCQHDTGFVACIKFNAVYDCVKGNEITPVMHSGV
ncbi:MAG: hypothetical protein WCQ95_09690 [Bacteroidota bacterium]